MSGSIISISGLSCARKHAIATKYWQFNVTKMSFSFQSVNHLEICQWYDTTGTKYATVWWKSFFCFQLWKWYMTNVEYCTQHFPPPLNVNSGNVCVQNWKTRSPSSRSARTTAMQWTTGLGAASCVLVKVNPCCDFVHHAILITYPNNVSRHTTFRKHWTQGDVCNRYNHLHRRSFSRCAPTLALNRLCQYKHINSGWYNRICC